MPKRESLDISIRHFENDFRLRLQTEEQKNWNKCPFRLNIVHRMSEAKIKNENKINNQPTQYVTVSEMLAHIIIILLILIHDTWYMVFIMGRNILMMRWNLRACYIDGRKKCYQLKMKICLRLNLLFLLRYHRIV